MAEENDTKVEGKADGQTTPDQATFKEEETTPPVTKDNEQVDDTKDDKSDDTTTTDDTDNTDNTKDDKGDDGEQEDVWGSTGDDAGDSVLALLKDAGATPDTAKALLWDAVKEGDVTKIDRDALVEAVGKGNANLVMAGMENYVTKIQHRTKEVTEAVHNAVNGADNWAAIRSWAKETLSESEMVDYAEMIDKGGRQAKIAAKDLAEQYVEAGNTLTQGTAVTPTGKPAPQTVTPLSRSDYFTAVEKLHKTGKADEASLNQLWKQRELGKAKGL